MIGISDHHAAETHRTQKIERMKRKVLLLTEEQKATLLVTLDRLLGSASDPVNPQGLQNP